MLPLCLLFDDYEKTFDYQVQCHAASLVEEEIGENLVDIFEEVNTGCSSDITY